tara:strand:- start:327 stop:1229 length:903 start_codon:yes stop_codon:yes gene_type:complete
MKIYYGVEGNYSDVTYIAKIKLLRDGILTIPCNDVTRAGILGDPMFGIVKHIKIGDKIYKHDEEIILNVEEDITNERKSWWETIGRHIVDPEKRLDNLHNYIALNYGSIRDEYPEQLMAMKYIRESDIVLEIGGNIGRNTCIIASILRDDSNLVSLECCQEYVAQLEENRVQNFFNFKIEASALSKVPLIQKDWNTFVSEIVLPGYKKVDTITFEEIKEKYNLDFNVLVADCEGALYQILKDEPNLLKNIETIIIENDFTDYTRKEYVDSVFVENGFRTVYNQAGGWGPCYSCFFQVWQK